MGTPTVYVVAWPEFGVIKVGFSSVQSTKRFIFSGANVVELFEFESTTDAYHVESWLHDDAHSTLTKAFDRAGELARNLLGSNGSGWRECYRATADDAASLIARSMHRANAPSICTSTCSSIEGRAMARTDVRTNARRRLSPTTETSSSVTRARTYGFCR